MFLLAKVLTNKRVLTVASIALLGAGGAAYAYTKFPAVREYVQSKVNSMITDVVKKLRNYLLSKVGHFGLPSWNQMPLTWQ